MLATRRFTNASTDRVNHGSLASLDNLPNGAFSVIAWIFREADDDSPIVGKGTFPNTWQLVSSIDFATFTVFGAVRMLVGRATTDADFVSVPGLIPLNRWSCAAGTCDLALGTPIDLYVGTETTPMQEVSGYDQAINGSGAYSGDAGEDLVVGNYSDFSDGFHGPIARVAIINRRLSLWELRSWQAELRKRKPRWRPGCVLLPDYSTSGVQRDRSPFGNHGVVTGTAAAAGLLELPPRRRRDIAFDSTPLPVGTLGQFDPELLISAWF